MRRPIKVYRNANFVWPGSAVPSAPVDHLRAIDSRNASDVEAFRSPRLTETFKQFLASGRYGVFALRDGDVVGHAWVTPPAHRRSTINGYARVERGESLIHYCYVEPSMRGRGIYAEMLHAVTHWALTRGAIVVRVDTGKDNVASQHGILRAGFTGVGCRTSIVLAGRLLWENRPREV